MTKYFVAAMLLSVCVIILLGQRLVLWCIIEARDCDMSFLMLFTAIKQGKFESISTSSELKAANLLQIVIGETWDSLMNTSPTQSVINVCETFGKFVRFTVKVDGESSTSSYGTTSMTNPGSSNTDAFQVLMAAQRKKQMWPGLTK